MSEFSISNSFPKVGGFNNVGGVEFKKFEPKTSTSVETGGSKDNFASLVEKTLQDIETTQVEANTAVRDLATGKNKNIHQVMMTLEKADTSLKLGMQIRNKIIDAYKEIMKMQV